MKSAKELKQDAYYVDIREKEWYRFSPEKLQQFIEQLCKEQIEKCLIEARNGKSIENAPNPDV